MLVFPLALKKNVLKKYVHESLMFLVIMFWIYFLSCVMQLFSSGLWQRGKRDQDGILGFLPADIRREQKRGLRLVSTFLPLMI